MYQTFKVGFICYSTVFLFTLNLYNLLCKPVNRHASLMV